MCACVHTWPIFSLRERQQCTGGRVPATPLSVFAVAERLRARTAAEDVRAEDNRPEQLRHHGVLDDS